MSRGKGQGFEEAGNTTLSIELKINDQLDQKITAVNTGLRGRNMVFVSRNKNFEFMNSMDDDYKEAFRQMFNRLINNGG